MCIRDSDKRVNSSMSTIKSLFVSGLLLVSLNGWSQSEMKEELCVIRLDSFGNGGHYSIVDSMPHFPGGNELINKFILENLKIPEDFISWNSKVITQFVVDTNGQDVYKRQMAFGYSF